MNVRTTGYDVRMIETFEQAREAVAREMQPLIGDGVILRVSSQGLVDGDAYLVTWGVEYPPLRGISTPLPGAATFVDKMTGFVSITSFTAEIERITRMTGVTA